MNGNEGEEHDRRVLEELRARWPYVPGEVRLSHLSGPAESYVLTEWRTRVGDAVHAPQVIATIETDSSTLDFEAYDSGILAEQCFAVGDIIPDGAVVARITLSAEVSTQ